MQAALSSGHKALPRPPCCEQDSVLLQGGQVDALSGVSRRERREESRRLSRWSAGYYCANLLATVKPTFGPAVSHVIHGRTWGAFIPLSQEACSLIMHKQDKKLLQCFPLPPPTSSPPCPDVTSNLNTYKSLREGEESFPSSSPKPKIFLKGCDWGGGWNGETKSL